MPNFRRVGENVQNLMCWIKNRADEGNKLSTTFFMCLSQNLVIYAEIVPSPTELTSPFLVKSTDLIFKVNR